MKDVHVHDRDPKNVDGDFYTTGRIYDNGECDGDCLACGLPEGEAPDLLAPLTDDNYDTYFVRQPESDSEIDQAIAATEVCCVDAVRYGGKDKNLLLRLRPEICDYMISENGEVVLNTNFREVESKLGKIRRIWDKSY